MEKDILKRDIIEQSRHLFIYGYKGEKRKELLKSLEELYPTRMDSKDPIAIYVEEYGLPKQSIDRSLDRTRLNTVAREHLQFSIASDILRSAQRNYSVKELTVKLEQLLKQMDLSGRKIKDSNELMSILQESKDFYKEYYEQYTTNGTELNINSIRIPFMMLELWVADYKRQMNIDSHLGIMIDNQEPISSLSVQNINSFVGSRCNKDISMKIATEPDDWSSYVDPNGQFVEAVHDYGTIEIDDCYRKVLEREKQRRG